MYSFYYLGFIHSFLGHNREGRRLQSHDLQESVLQIRILLDVPWAVGTAWLVFVWESKCLINAGSGWYSCNRYDDEAAKKARDAQERSRAALQRYLHYYTRYLNHHNSLKLERKARIGGNDTN